MATAVEDSLNANIAEVLKPHSKVDQSHMDTAYQTPVTGPPPAIGHYAPYQPPLLQPGPHAYPSAPAPYPQHQYSIQPGYMVSSSMSSSFVPSPMSLPAISSAPSGIFSGSKYNTAYTFDTTGQIAPPGMKPLVTATLWEDEDSLCFQVEAKGICVARREDNHMINGTKLLNVAGMMRGRRDGILKSEKTRHVVKIGPLHLKGVWIPFDRALDFANREKITEQLYPLFVHDIGALLYHPSNQPRPGIGNSSALAAVNRRRSDTRLTGAFLPTTSTPPLYRHHSQIAPSPFSTHPATRRSSPNRVHTFPTPPTSASSNSGLLPGAGKPDHPHDSKSQGGYGIKSEHEPAYAHEQFLYRANRVSNSYNPDALAVRSEDVNSSPHQYGSGPEPPRTADAKWQIGYSTKSNYATYDPGEARANGDSYAPFPSTDVKNPIPSAKRVLEVVDDADDDVMMPKKAGHQVGVPIGTSLILVSNIAMGGTPVSSPPTKLRVEPAKIEKQSRRHSFSSRRGASAIDAILEDLNTPGKHAESLNKPDYFAKHNGMNEVSRSNLELANIVEFPSENRQPEPQAESASRSDVSDTVESADSSDDSYASSPPDMSIRKVQLVNRLMGYFFSLFSTCCRSPRITTLGYSNTDQERQNMGQSSLSSEKNLSSRASQPSNKRKAEDKLEGDDTSEDGNGNGPPKKTKSDNPPESNISAKFACPYFKRNPRKYQSMRSCTGPGFDTVHRLKEHLYRLHRLPVQCSRCSQTFKSDEFLVQHQRQDPPCPVQQRQNTEGIDRAQEAQLKSRKKEADEVTERDKWRRVYRILFPYDDHSKMPSPYYEYGLVEAACEANDAASAELSRYEAYLRQELPYSLRRELELRVDTLLESAEETLRSQLPTIFRDLQMRHFREYLQQRSLGLTDTPANVGQEPTQISAGNDSQRTPAATDAESAGNADILNDLAPMDPTTWPLDWFDGTIFNMPLGDVVLSESGYSSLDTGITGFIKSNVDDTDTNVRASALGVWF